MAADETLIVAAIECDEAWPPSCGTRKFRIRRGDFPPSSHSSSSSCTGRELRAAIARLVLRSIGAEGDDDTGGVTVEAHDGRRGGEFVSLLRDDVKDEDAAARFGKRIRCIVSDLPPSLVGFGGDEGRGGGATGELPAIAGRFFPYDPDGIDYAGGKLVVKEIENNRSNGTGLNVWDGALLLARYLEKHPDRVCSKRVLELGSGCGLVGIAAGLLGAEEIVLTDLPYAIGLMKDNVDRNAPALERAGCKRAECLVYDWYKPQTMRYFGFETKPVVGTKLFSAEADVVLVADCVWVEELVAPLLQVFENIISHSSSQLSVIISYQRRGKLAHEAFWNGVHSIFRTVVQVDLEHLGLAQTNIHYLLLCKV
uniref:Calmodulin-lysine N-methyltransferase n=2 Tax=Trieres chinensis TaxID=1514140 RepID=A0A7S1ZER4_TRICV|mmetsp:Transcript_24106/g.48811  ORF Transcript_24106/g.48811 Transcript_24106/m.48811 type:complete len:368 (+) Transcript_24106:14-1117(+)